jgi:DNA-directed RNA polymerase specialized sigma24 family protein
MRDGRVGESAPQAVPTSDAELIKAVATGDAAAYAELRDRHRAAARNLAGNLVRDPAAAEAVLSETLAQLRGVLRRGEGPTEAMRQFLLTALRRVAHEPQEGGDPVAAASQEGAVAAAGQAGAGAVAVGQDGGGAATAASQTAIPNLGEPLFTDPAAAELENDPLARAFRSLPERLQAVLWHTEIERGDPAETIALLGVTADGLARLGAQARAAIGRGYLGLLASARAGQECQEAAAKLDLHLAGASRGADEAMVQRHLRGCRDCRAAAIELTGISRSLRRAVAPIFLGPAADAYLAAAEAKPAQAGTALPGPAAAAVAWLSHAPRRIGQVPLRIREASREHQALAGGVVLLAVAVAAGLTLTLAANGSPQHTAQDPVPAAIAPSNPSATSLSPSASPSRSRSAARSRQASTTRLVDPAGQRGPASAKSPSRAPGAAGAPTSPPSAAPSPKTSPSPRPTPSPSPRRHRHRHPITAA